MKVHRSFSIFLMIALFALGSASAKDPGGSPVAVPTITLRWGTAWHSGS